MAVSPKDHGMVLVVVEDMTYEEHGGILKVASPVFARMLDSAMKEAAEQKIVLAGKAKTEYEAVMKFLRPGSARAQKIDINNVDFLITWFGEYEMDMLKTECEDFLLNLPCSIDRLLQAKKLRLTRQYPRCLTSIARSLPDQAVERLVEEVEILQELIPVIKQEVSIKQRVHREEVSKMKATYEQKLSTYKQKVKQLPDQLKRSLEGSGNIQYGKYEGKLVKFCAETKLQELIAQIPLILWCSGEISKKSGCT